MTPAREAPPAASDLVKNITHMDGFIRGDAAKQIEAALAAARAEGAREPIAALEDAVEHGLIYWEPNTSRGHFEKALMLERCRKVLAANKPEAELKKDPTK